MNKLLLSVLAGCALGLASAAARDVLPLGENWRFCRGDVSGAEQPNFNDLFWQVVRVPHDWSIAGPFAKTNSASAAGAFLPGGTAWYRNEFALPSSAADRRVIGEFDGVMGQCDVWINGLHLGHQADGAGGFHYELPPALLAFGSGTNNVLTVRTDTSERPAAAYTGAGICRPVRLLIVSPVHFAKHGKAVSLTQISDSETTVRVDTRITNESAEPCEITLQTSLISPGDDLLSAVESSQLIQPGASATIDQPIDLAAPQVWTLEHPVLYHAIAELRVKGSLVDQSTSAIAVRTIRFDARQGLRLNGKPLALRAVRLFPDGGAFGMAVPPSIWESRLRALKSLGVNAIRTEILPATPEFLSLCDRLGLLAVDEFPEGAAAVGDHADLGIDYLGGPLEWPGIGHDSGLLDRTGAISPLGRRRQSEWQEPFLAATLKAIGAGEDRATVTNAPPAAGRPFRVVLTADRATLSPSWDDVTTVRADLVDSQETTVPGANNLVVFKVSGPAFITAVDNADNIGPEQFETNRCAAFQGRCVAYLRATGESGRISVTATADGLKSGSITLRAVPPEAP